MKTPGLTQQALAGSSSIHLAQPDSQSYLPSKSSTPLRSPLHPYSVGQPYPPKHSPTVSKLPPRSASPSYFGLVVEPAQESRDSDLPREHWSPTSSAVRLFSAALPKQLPVDANPEFEAFRRQVDANKGRAPFHLATSHLGAFGPASNGAPPSGTTPPPPPPSQPQFLRPRLPRWCTQGSDASDSSLPCMPGQQHLGHGSKPSVTSVPSSHMDVDSDSLHDSAYVSADSKRNSEASLHAPSFLSTGRHEPSPPSSPSSYSHSRSDASRSVSESAARCPPRLSMPLPPLPRFTDIPLCGPSAVARPWRPPAAAAGAAAPEAANASGAPGSDGGGPSMMTPEQLQDLIRTAPAGELLLLDLRVSPQYAQFHIKGALNLCIPTTLLKRATFNLQKLQQTFQSDDDRDKFARWRDARHLVVYDASSFERRDATSAMNMLKKFANEGYPGAMHVLRGGFNAFCAAYPDLVESNPDSSSSTSPQSRGARPGGGSRAHGDRPSIAPVVGGVVLPSALGSGSSPFFGNIRQNQDLVDGVGQMDIGVPPGLDRDTLPHWLRDAVDEQDHGKRVSDKFLEIELREKSRMTKAFSSAFPSNAATSNGPASQKAAAAEGRVQLSGLEQGGKNRYKDILPFEHARVRLEGKVEGSCDYVNASHLKSSGSHKRYIASQGPLPATFEDFWSVIWDQDVRVIVMLTAESEGGQLKCHPYWTGKEFGPIRLRALSEKRVSLDLDAGSSGPLGAASQTNGDDPSRAGGPAEAGRRRAHTTTAVDGASAAGNGGSQQQQQQPSNGSGETPYVIIRKFALSHTAHPFAPIREITHLHYPSWPDFGTPARPSHLLALVELANGMQRASLPVRTTEGHDRPGGGGGRRGSVAGLGGGAGGRRNSDPLFDARSADLPEPNDHVRPMLVHCSAGCGRTGAFCTVDSVIDMLKRQRHRAAVKGAAGGGKRAAAAEGEKRIAEPSGETTKREKRRALEKRRSRPGRDEPGSPLATFKEPPPLQEQQLSESNNGYVSRGSTDDEDSDEEGIDTSWLDDDSVDLIARTVEDFRGQRLSMVQSLRQFVLCYETVMEWIWRLQQHERGGAASTTAGEGGSRGRARSGSMAV